MGLMAMATQVLEDYPEGSRVELIVTLRDRDNKQHDLRTYRDTLDAVRNAQKALLPPLDFKGLATTVLRGMVPTKHTPTDNGGIYTYEMPDTTIKVEFDYLTTNDTKIVDFLIIPKS